MIDEKIDFDGLTRDGLMTLACDVIDEQRRHVADQQASIDRKFWRYKFSGLNHAALTVDPGPIDSAIEAIRMADSLLEALERAT